MRAENRAAGGPALSVRQLNRATLARQMLLGRERVAAPRAIETLVALQAQLPRPPFLGLWARVEGFERKELTRLLRQRRVVRGTLLRRTLHVATAKDFVALRPAMQPVLDAGMRTILRALRASVDAERLAARAREVLAEGPQTFEQIRDRLKRDLPGTNERALGFAVRMLLPLVQVPEDDAPWAFVGNPRFALADEWLGKPFPTQAREVPGALVLRYLAAYGPASVADLQAWCGLQKPKEKVDALRPRLVTFRDERGRELFDLPAAPRPEADVPAPVRLVADYDNLVTTRADERFVARSHRPRVFLPGLRIAATVLVDGFVAGTWRSERKKGGTSRRRSRRSSASPSPTPARTRSGWGSRG